MIDVFRNWINILLCLGIFTTILQLVMPNNKLRKYIYSLIGVVTIITVVSPFINLMKNKNMESAIMQVVANIDETKIENIDEVKYKAVNQNAIKENFISSLKQDISSKLKQEGVDVIKSNVFLDSNYNIEKIEINIKKIEKNVTQISTITEVVKYINKEYDVDFSKIIVVEEGK